ncbi:unnamed protein product [Cunninghamella blakesleeana]
MSVYSLISEYERELNELLVNGYYREYKQKLKKGLISFKSESSSICYLRLWLYYATLVKNPIPIYQFLINNYIGTSFSLLYEDIAFYYYKKGHILEAKHTLEYAITCKAIPTHDLQQALSDLNNNNDIEEETLPPSIKKPLPPNDFLLTQQPILGVGLGSMNLISCLDAMKSYIHYLSNESSTLKGFYFGSNEKLFEEHHRPHLNNDKIDIKDNGIKLKKQKLAHDNTNLQTKSIQKRNLSHHPFEKLQLKDINSKNQPVSSVSSTSALKNKDDGNQPHDQQKNEERIDHIHLEYSSQMKYNSIDYHINSKPTRVLSQIENEIYLSEKKSSQKKEGFFLENQRIQYGDDHPQDQIQQLIPKLTVNENNNNSNDVVLFSIKTPSEKMALSNNNINNNEVIIVHSSSLIQSQQQQGQQLTKKTSPIIVVLPLPYDQKQSLAASLVEKYLINTLKHNINPSTFNKVKKNWQKKKPQLIKIDLKETNDDDDSDNDYTNILWLNSFIGSGRYGKVYGVKWRNQQLALKVQTPVDLWDYCILQYIHEQYSSSRWNPYIVKPHTLFKDENTSYFIMDHLRQGTLYDFLLFYLDKNKTSIPEALIQLFALRLLQAVASLHKIHVTHNDIKLDNIMINLYSNNNSDNDNDDGVDQLDELPLVYNKDDTLWKKQSIQLIDFGLAINLDFFPDSFLAKAGWTPSKKNTEMPAVQSGSSWIPFHLDYFSLANCIHILLHEKSITNGNPSRSKRYWDKSLWDDFFDSLLHPTSISIDDGVSALNNLINRFEHSLTHGQHNCTIRKHLLYFITHNHLQKI